ncbi:MAG: hypothetical protein FD189_2476 [Elusimicrobia bacterium]|nr:MAG: hypothetical protein FD154_2431 [Elusimicrobiota bacterium]KAF0152505.1 MAG: hypothetical protein FD189_2476 [Elusimicrobiota bacterium]
MTASQFFIVLTPIVGLFFFSVICLFAYKVRPEDGPPAPEALRPLTKTCILIIRSTFVYAAGLLALHRAWAIYLILALEYSQDPGIRGNIGIGLMVADPWGILFTLGPVITIEWFTGIQLVSDRMLPAFYMFFSAVIDGFFIRLLWGRARHAFLRPPEEIG